MADGSIAETHLPNASVGLHPTNVAKLNCFRTWKDFVHDNFPWLEHRDHSDGQFQAEVSAYQLGIGSLSTIRANASEVIRTRHLAEASEAGYLKLMWQMSGAVSVEQDGHETVVNAGQATVCDTARPYRIRVGEGSHFAVFMLPYESCPGWEHISRHLCGRSLEECPTTRAALGALMGLASLPHDPADEGNSTVVQAVQLMLSSSLHRAATRQGLASFESQKLSKVQKHIRDHMDDPSLDANDLAGALCMSRRSLYTLFNQYDTTPARMITGMRLDRCREMLVDAKYGRRKITDLAFEVGFGDYATFSRLFKAKFGATPRGYRIRGGSGLKQ